MLPVRTLPEFTHKTGITGQNCHQKSPSRLQGNWERQSCDHWQYAHLCNNEGKTDMGDNMGLSHTQGQSSKSPAEGKLVKRSYMS